MNGKSNEPPRTIAADSPAQHRSGPDRTASAPEARRAGQAGWASVGLTPPPCPRRGRRLEEAGVIGGHRVVTDPRALGQGREAHGGVLRGGHRVPPRVRPPRLLHPCRRHRRRPRGLPHGGAERHLPCAARRPAPGHEEDQGRSMAPRRWTSSRPHNPDRPRAKDRSAWTTASARWDTSRGRGRSSWSRLPPRTPSAAGRSWSDSPETAIPLGSPRERSALTTGACPGTRRSPPAARPRRPPRPGSGA